jgi:hypothetical protein
VLAFSDIIEFLLRLVRDDDARAQFEQDPQATLAGAGLAGVTAQDIRDARLQLADSGAVHAVDGGGHPSYPDGDDPVREIGHTTAHYAADEHLRYDAPDHGGAADHGGTTTFLTIDDRDTLFFQSISDDDVTITDNSVAVTDSFNEDNSQVTAVQVRDSFNSDDDTSMDAVDSFNSDDDVVAIQDNDVNGGDETIAVDTQGSLAADPLAVDAAGADPEPVDLPEPEPEPVALDEPSVTDPVDEIDEIDEIDDPADDPAADDPADVILA